MAIQLIIKDTRNPSKVFERFFIENRVVIGRSKTCHVCLPDLSVSSIHMHIFLDGNEYRAMDLGSLNGVSVGNRRLIDRRPRRLLNNDIIHIAHYEIEFRLGVRAAGTPGRVIGQTQAKQMLGAILKDNIDQDPALVVTKGPGGAKRFQLVSPECRFVIGRGRQNEINIDDRDLSRRHAEVIVKDGKVTVKDLGGRRGIVVDGRKVEQIELAQGDSFTVGNTVLSLEHTIEPALRAIQKAPEDETSSFSPEIAVQIDKDTQELPVSDNESRPGELRVDLSDVRVAQDFSDPLLPRETADYVRTQEIPVSAGNNKSDTGLIVAGIILMLVSVFGLAWMLT